MLDPAARARKASIGLVHPLLLAAALWMPGVGVLAQEPTPGVALPEVPAPEPTAVAQRIGLDEALAEAARTGARSVVFFGADWSPWSVAMERKVLSDPRVLEAQKQARLTIVDARESPEIPDRYGVVDFPSVLVLGASGNEVTRYRGYMSAESLSAALAAAAGARFAPEPQGQGVEELLSRIAWLRERGRLKEAAEEARKIVDLDAENIKGFTDNAMAFLGLLEVRQGNEDRAYAIYSRMSELYPSTELRAHMFEALGHSASKLGLRQEALRAYELFLKEFPRHADAAFVRGEVQKLKRLRAQGLGR